MSCITISYNLFKQNIYKQREIDQSAIRYEKVASFTTTCQLQSNYIFRASRGLATSLIITIDWVSYPQKEFGYCRITRYLIRYFIQTIWSFSMFKKINKLHLYLSYIKPNSRIFFLLSEVTRSKTPNIEPPQG